MFDRKRIAVVATTMALGAAPLAMAQAPQAKPGMLPGAGDVVMHAASMKWEPGPLKGTQVAKLWGDWMKGGPYGVLVKFDAGLTNATHKHTHDLKIVVLKGEFMHHPDGGKAVLLGPGSYLLQAGGKEHVSGCGKAAPCEFFMMSHDKFDLIPKAEPPKGK